MEIRDILIAKLNNNNDVEEYMVDLAVGEAESLVKDYCNIIDIPSGLTFITANIALDIINKNYISDDNVKSIQQGDTTISFKDIEEDRSILNNYSRDLNRHRRLKK